MKKNMSLPEMIWNGGREYLNRPSNRDDIRFYQEQIVQ